MQLLKYLQAQGLGSRKQCQWLIDNDCVAVNGEIRNDGKSEIDPAEVCTLHIDGEAVQAVPQPYFYIVLNKPADYETSHKRAIIRACSACFPTTCATSICRPSDAWMPTPPAFC